MLSFRQSASYLLGPILMVGLLAGSQMNPVILSLDPASGPPGSTVTATGKNFVPTSGTSGTSGGADDYGGNTVHFGSEISIKHINSTDGLVVKFEVPRNAAPGTYSVTIVNSNGASNSATFTVIRDRPQ